MIKDQEYHLLDLITGKYLYDRNTDGIIKVPDDVYMYLNGEISNNKYVDDYINYLKKNGLLLSELIGEGSHPLTDMLDYYLKNKMTHIILQVTQECNLRCEYCVYSDNYITRIHNTRKMSFETAKKAIDLLIKNSRDSERVSFSFYGGEPLLEFNLIKDCVKYAKEKGEGRNISFRFTTNGTLLTKEKLPFLVDNNFTLLISLDGPYDIHNIHRKFANDNKGSFEKIYENLKLLKELYPQFYKENISFNTVLDPNNSFDYIKNYFDHDPMYKNNTFSFSTISEDYSKNNIYYSPQFIEEERYMIFLTYLNKLRHFRKNSFKSKFTEPFFANIKEVFDNINSEEKGFSIKKGHRGGPCIPGRIRAFVSVDGNIFLCEKISETSEAGKIGNVNTGLDKKKVRQLLNIESNTKELCKNCWAYHRCNICAVKADDGTNISVEVIKASCIKMKKEVDSILKDYCVLKYLGIEKENF